MLPAGQKTEYGSPDSTYTVSGITYDRRSGRPISAPMSIDHREGAAKPTNPYYNPGGVAEATDPSPLNTPEDKQQDVERLPVNISPLKGTTTKDGGSGYLRYPYEQMNGTQDYIQFGAIDYQRRSRGSFSVVTREFTAGEGGLVGGPAGTGESQQELNKRIVTSITLPVPSQIADSNANDYGGTNLNFLQQFGLQAGNEIIRSESLEEFIKGIFNAGEGAINLGTQDNVRELINNYFAINAVNSFGGNLDLNQVLARNTGQIINPNMELLFNSPTLRQFSFQFKFTPRFQKEGEEVRKIIRAFKRHSAPKGGNNQFLKTPDIFQIRYLGEGGRSHQFLNRFKLCALTNMQVNYTGDGTYATYGDETPVSMIMTLNFQELTPIYAEDYNSEIGGVGY